MSLEEQLQATKRQLRLALEAAVRRQQGDYRRALVRRTLGAWAAVARAAQEQRTRVLFARLAALVPAPAQSAAVSCQTEFPGTHTEPAPAQPGSTASDADSSCQTESQGNRTEPAPAQPGSTASDTDSSVAGARWDSDLSSIGGEDPAWDWTVPAAHEGVSSEELLSRLLAAQAEARDARVRHPIPRDPAAALTGRLAPSLGADDGAERGAAGGGAASGTEAHLHSALATGPLSVIGDGAQPQ
eukprot:COSAG01_NODE_1327_length_10710_cov_2074.778155_11_plen_242_part_01